MKHEIVMKGEISRSESTELLGKNREVWTAFLLRTQLDQIWKNVQWLMCTKVKEKYGAVQQIQSEHGM